MKWEFPRLCRGGSQTLRIPGVYLPLLPSFCRSPLPREPRAVAVASAFQRLRSGPFEGPATVKPPALPEDTYSATLHGWFIKKTKQQRNFAALLKIHLPALLSLNLQFGPMPEFRLPASPNVPVFHLLFRVRSRERGKGEDSQVEECHVARRLPGLDARYGCGRIRWPPLPAFQNAQS